MRRLFLILLVFALFPIGSLFAQDSSIEIRTKTPDVKVFVGEQFRGVTNYNSIIEMHYLKIPISTGTYTVRCEAVGFSPNIQKVTVTTLGAQVLVEFVGVKDQAESIKTTQSTAEALTGKILVFSEPSGASIDVDGRKQTALTNAAITTGIGNKKVRVYFSSRALDIQFQLEPAEELTIKADFNNMTINVNKKVTLHFSSEVQGVALTLDGKNIGVLPMSIPFDIRDKAYSAKFSLDGYEDKVLNLEPKANDMVSVALSPLKRSLNVTSNPSGASVYIQEQGSKKYIGSTPFTYIIPSTGTYTFYGEKTDYLKYESKSTSITFGINDKSKNINLALVEVNGVTIKIQRDKSYTPSEQLIVADKQHGNLSAINQITVPSGRQTIRLGASTTSFNFEQGKTYTITPLIRIPDSKKESYIEQKDASSLSGYQETIPEPKYLKETQTTYTQVPDLLGGNALMGLYMGGSAGLLVGLFTQLNVDGDPSVIGGLTVSGAAIGWLIGGLINPRSQASGSTPVPENIEKNRQTKQQWQSDMNTIHQNNKGLVDTYNAQIKARNDEIDRANQTRGVIMVSDGKLETKVALQ